MSPELVHTIVEAGVGVVSAWVGVNQHRNRNSGRTRDHKLDALRAEVRESMREVATQVAAYGQTLWGIQADVKVLTNRVQVLERELERERDRNHQGRPLP